MEEFRADKESAREVFELLLPDEKIRRQCLEFLANSVQVANRLASGHWGITLYSDLARMNCGMIEIVGVLADQMHVIVDVEALPIFSQELVEIRKGSGKGFYPSVPGSAACDFNAEQASIVLPQIAEAHEKLIEKASRTAFTPNRKSAHSPGVIEFLRDYLNQPLPQPTYFDFLQKDATILGSATDFPTLPEEVEASEIFSEGSVRQILETTYERDPQARAKCIAHYGFRCVVCGMSFEEVYGSVGSNFIHVHHLTPLSSIGESVLVDPIKDLRPVCANCHAIIHRRNPPYTPEEVSQIIAGEEVAL